MAAAETESRDGVKLTNLDQPLFGDADATKRDLVDYLDAIASRIVPALTDRPLSVIRVQRDEQPFMQKNVPKYTPDWVRTITLWAETSKRDVSYALCNDRRTLLWFANQRAIEYHPTLVRTDQLDRATHLVLDLDPPVGESFGVVVSVAKLVRRALDGAGLEGAVKTSGAKGLHVFVPIDPAATAIEDAAAGHGRSPPERSNSTRRSPPRHSSRTIAAARCSSTRPASVEQPSSPPIARVLAPACRCRSRCGGTISTPSNRRTSRSTQLSTTSATPIRGPR